MPVTELPYTEVAQDPAAAPTTVPQGYKRVNVNFSPDTYAMLANLAAIKGTSMSEILRQAISLAKFVQDVKVSGDQLLVNRHGSVSELIIQ